MTYRTISFLFLVSLIFILGIVECQANNPQLMLQKTDVEDVRKAQIYLQKQLQMYDQNRFDNYTLYLAVKNYAQRLQNLELTAINKLGRGVLGSLKGDKQIERVYLGSVNKAKNNGQFAFAKTTFLGEDKSFMYFKKWIIDLSKIL